MDEDVNMDSPQISTLREENTPPPSRTSKFRVKLLVTEKKGKGKSSSPSVPVSNKKVVSPPPAPQTQAQPDDEVEEDDEEDQLIDDEDDVQQAASTPTCGTKRKAPPRKPKPSKIELDTNPQEPAEQPDFPDVSMSADGEDPPPKKKAALRRTSTAQRPRAKVPPKAAKNLAVPPLDDGVQSESYTVTAPSSPILLARDGASEHDDKEHVPAPPEGAAEMAPLPIYPLPSKPFPVQPPLKIGTGLAPVLPLDRSGSKVRRWRIANREIRGIAGGRWFARSWVGDKESEFTIAASATAMHKNGEGDKITTLKVGGSISAPLLGKASGRSRTARALSGISAVPSRAASIIPDHHLVKAPSKMRNIVAGPAPEEGNPLAGDPY